MPQLTTEQRICRLETIVLLQANIINNVLFRVMDERTAGEMSETLEGLVELLSEIEDERNTVQWPQPNESAGSQSDDLDSEDPTPPPLLA